MKKQIQKIAKQQGTSLKQIGREIGRPNYTLERGMDTEAISIKALKQCLACMGGVIVLKFGENQIELK